VTTKEWLDDYLEGANGQGKNNKKAKLQNKKLEIFAPARIPVLRSPSEIKKQNKRVFVHHTIPVRQNIERDEISAPKANIVFALALSFILFFAGGFFVLQQPQNLSILNAHISDVVKDSKTHSAIYLAFGRTALGQSLLLGAQNKAVIKYSDKREPALNVWLSQSETIKNAAADMGFIFKYFTSTGKEEIKKAYQQGWQDILKNGESFFAVAEKLQHAFFGLWKPNQIAENQGESILKNTEFKKSVNQLEENIIENVRQEFKIHREELGISQDKGMIVMPSTENDKDIKKKIESTFSDEVEIDIDDDGFSGIIKPVFKEQNEQEYLYMMVPLTEDLDADHEQP